MNTQQQQPHHSESLINTCGFVYSLHGEGVRWVHAMLVRHCGKYSFSWGFAKLRDTRIYNIIFVYLGAHIRHTFQIVWLAGNEKKNDVHLDLSTAFMCLLLCMPQIVVRFPSVLNRQIEQCGFLRQKSFIALHWDLRNILTFRWCFSFSKLSDKMHNTFVGIADAKMFLHSNKA